MIKKRFISMLVLLVAVVTGAWALPATPNSIVINGTPQVGDKSISLTYHFNPNNVSGISSYAPTLKVKCAADNKWDEMTLSLSDVSSGTTSISLNNLGEFEAGKTYDVCFAYYNGTWVDDVFQSFVPAGPPTYAITLAEGTEDADKWTVKVGEGEAQAFPVEGLEGETVTATYSGTKRVKSVKAVKKAAVPVTAITLNKTETSIKVGATETLSVTSVLPEEATDKTYTWKTSDETKATVDQNGKVTAVAEGTVIIYAEANDGSGVKGNCTVTSVTPVTITVKWNNNDITGTGNSFTKDGVTLTAGQIDYEYKDISLDGTFTTTLGNFTKIEVTTAWFGASGTGWSSGTGFTPKTGTWTGNASSVPFSGNIWGQGEGNTKFVFTIEKN